jgi:hypothetical protein
MQLKTFLNHVQKYKSFVYKQVRWAGNDQSPELEIEVVEPSTNCFGTTSQHTGQVSSWTNGVAKPCALKIEPMKKVARMLRNHRELMLNWFRAKGQLSSGVVEGFNNKAKLTSRKSFGFRTFRVAENALYHALGDLPEPEGTHRFF